MAELIAAYEAPDASFDSAAAPEIALAIAVTTELLERTALRQQLIDVLADVLREAGNLSGDEGSLGVGFEADGYLRVTRICSGWTLPARPDRADNGALVVTATFSQAGLDPIVWASVEACRYRVGDGQIELDRAAPGADALSVYWGTAPSSEAVSSRTLLVDLNLEATIEGERIPLGIDFRSLVDGTLEYRIPRPDGSLVARVGAGASVTLRAQNGIFECDDELACAPRPTEAP